MSVWLALPSKRRPDEVEKVLCEWRKMGYRIAVRRDHGDSYMETKPDLLIVGSDYPGYAISVNRLCYQIMEVDSGAEWIVAAGDDTLPDPTNKATDIGQSCTEFFGKVDYKLEPSLLVDLWNSTCLFGVMQPTGDQWADRAGRIIERIAGSPWIGREFARRMYGGAGPYWHEYTHCFVDEELQCVAQKLGVFWQRPDLTQHHNNWARVHAGRPQDMPAFLAEANSPEHWAKYSAIFKARKAAGFPGSEPIL